MSTREPLVKLRDAADQLGVSYATIRRYVAAGRITVVRLNPRSVRIAQSDIDAFVKAYTEPATALRAIRRRAS